MCCYFLSQGALKILSVPFATEQELLAAVVGETTMFILVLLSFGRQGGVGQMTSQLRRKPKVAGWERKVGDGGCFQSRGSLR